MLSTHVSEKDNESSKQRIENMTRNLLNNPQRNLTLHETSPRIPIPFSSFNLTSYLMESLNPFTQTFARHLSRPESLLTCHRTRFLKFPLSTSLFRRVVQATEPTTDTQFLFPFHSSLFTQTFHFTQRLLVTSQTYTLLRFRVCTSVQLEISLSVLLEISLATNGRFYEAIFTLSIDFFSLDLSPFPSSDSFSYTCRLSPSDSDTQIPFLISTDFYPLATQFRDRALMVILPYISSPSIQQTNYDYEPLTTEIVSVPYTKTGSVVQDTFATKYTGCTDKKKLRTKSMDLPFDLTKCCQVDFQFWSLQHLAFQYTLFKSPAPSLSLTVIRRLSPEDISLIPFYLTNPLEEVELLSPFSDPDCALLRNARQTPFEKPCLTSGPSITTLPEINSGPSEPIQDYFESTVDVTAAQNKVSKADMTTSNSATPENVFVFSAMLGKKKTKDSLAVKDPSLSLTAYKRVAQKVKPVPTTFPGDCTVRRIIPEDPMLTLPPLPYHPPDFLPTSRITMDRIKILDVNGDSFLWPEEEKLFKHIMVLNQEAIAFEDAERGTFKESYFSPYIIPTVPHVPWEYKNIPIAPGIREKVMDVLRLKIEAGVYERSSSSYRSQWFVVLKKNGKLRIVHDLQPLNKVTVRDAGNVPVVDDFVEGFAGRQCYTVFDLFWGFDARKIHPRSRELTAFSTPMGLLQITSLPTGFTNSPAEFQKCMSIILQDEIPTVANIFIDDLPVKGPTSQYLDSEGKPEVLEVNPKIRRFIWEHALDVHRIMHKVKCAGATFAASKAQICRPEALIIGQTCNAAGRSPDTTRVEKILTWPPLTTPRQVRQFLGLCGTVRIWIPNYSKLVQPLTELFRKGYEFIWDERRQNAFETIKSLVSSAPALHPINYQSDNAVVLSVDSSKEAVGFILSQLADDGKTKRPARYGSIPMGPTESRYSQPKLELFGLYQALHEWRIYIIGVKKLIVEVDAKYIKGMLKSPDLQPNASTVRWIQGIKLFDFELVHVPADKHRGPDALSRRPLTELEFAKDHDDSWLDNIALMIFTPHADFPPFPKQEECHRQRSQPGLQCYLARKHQNETLQDIYNFHKAADIPRFDNLQAQKRFLSKCGEFFLKNSRLFKKNGNRPPLIVVTDADHKYSILLHAHEKLGHRGIFAVKEIIGARFFWPNMRADIYHHIKSCHECQIRSLKRLEIPLTVSLPTVLFSKIYVDIMHMPPAHGYKYIVAAKDDLSGTSEAAPLRAATAKNLAKFFWEFIYCRYGAPQNVITDNGSEVKEAFERLLKRLNIPQIRITPYNHHANGVVERGHFIIREALLKTCKDKLTEWPHRLPEIVFADRVTTNRVTGFSPYQLLHATDPLLPLDIAEATFLVEEFRSGISTEELLKLRARQIAKYPDDLARAAETLRKARFTSKRNFEERFLKRLSHKVHQAGDLVLIRNVAIEMSHDRKHKQRYLGPYEVIGQTLKGNYLVKELDGTPLNYTYAAFRILPYISRNHPFMKNHQEEESSSEDTSDEEEDSDLD